MGLKKTFTEIYKTNFWHDKESVSGHGSSMAATKSIREELPTLFINLGITSILDAACGDFHWMQGLLHDLPYLQYLGYDVVRELMVENTRLYDSDSVHFRVCNIVKDPIRKSDLILARDVLGHLSNIEVVQSLKNFRASGSTWLLATTFPHHDNGNKDITAGEWRPINLSDFKFGLGPPVLLIDEKCAEGGVEFKDKSLGLWRLNK